LNEKKKKKFIKESNWATRRVEDVLILLLNRYHDDKLKQREFLQLQRDKIT
jgi:hypothetical protein